MITAKDQLFSVEVDFLGNSFDKAPKIGRGHPSIATILIDLITGGLDQNRRTICLRLQESCLDHQGMRRTYRGDPALKSGVMAMS
jgi:hypothetical protein